MHPTQNTAVLAEPPCPPRRHALADLPAGITPVQIRPLASVAPVGVDVAVILRDAATYLDRYGWIQGCYFDPTATVFTPAACVVGAIGMVCYGGPVEAPTQHFGQPGFEQFEAALLWLDWYLLDRYGADAFAYNDARGRTHADVYLVLHEAADAWAQLGRGGVA